MFVCTCIYTPHLHTLTIKLTCNAYYEALKMKSAQAHTWMPLSQTDSSKRELLDCFLSLFQQHVCGGDKGLTHTDRCTPIHALQTKSETNPQVSPVQHSAKCNNPLAEYILPAEHFLLHTFWDYQQSVCVHFWQLTPLSMLFVTSIEKVPVFLLTMAFLSYGYKAKLLFQNITMRIFILNFHKSLTVSSWSSHSTSDRSTLL